MLDFLSQRAFGRAAVGIILALLVMEGVCRQVYFLPKDEDPLFGTVPKAGARIRYALEGSGTCRWLQRGVRAGSLPVPVGSPSLLIIGDSFTEALQVDDDQVYSAVLQRELCHRGIVVDVMNIGCSGWAAPNYVRRAADFRTAFSPSRVVIQVRDDDFTTDAWDQGKDHFTRVSQMGALAVSGAARKSRKQRLWFHQVVDELRRSSALVDFATYRFAALRHGWSQEPPLFRAAAARKDKLPTVAPAPEDGYPVAEEVEVLCKAYPEGVTFLYLPPYDPESCNGPSDFEQELVRLAASSGASVVSLRASFPEFLANQTAPYGFNNSQFNKGHLNADGHDAAGRLLAENLAGVLRQ